MLSLFWLEVVVLMVLIVASSSVLVLIKSATLVVLIVVMRARVCSVSIFTRLLRMLLIEWILYVADWLRRLELLLLVRWKNYVLLWRISDALKVLRLFLSAKLGLTWNE